jgi:hypothetical protein
MQTEALTSKKSTRYASAADCSAQRAWLWYLRSCLKSCEISLTNRANGALRSKSSVDFWYFLPTARPKVGASARGIMIKEGGKSPDLPQSSRPRAPSMGLLNSTNMYCRLASRCSNGHLLRGASASGAIGSLLRPAFSALQYASACFSPPKAMAAHLAIFCVCQLAAAFMRSGLRCDGD